MTSRMTLPVSVASILIGATPLVAAAGGQPAPHCLITWEGETDLDMRFDRASRDLTACVQTGGITSRAGRRGQAAIAQLRDLAAYDERRAWGTQNELREQTYDRRLRSLMATIMRASN